MPTMRPRFSLARRIAAALLAAAALGATVSPAAADVREGVTAWEAGNPAQAIAIWRPLAIAGDADAQFNLGQAYKLGRGVAAPDLNEAAAWFRRAADQGHLQASDNLGLVLYELNQKGDALPWLEQSASRGEPRAQYVLAAELFNGDRISRDWPRAYALMKRATDAGLQRATAALVQMDSYIPLEQRQQGLALAATFEQSEGQARLAAMTATTAPRAAPTPTIQPTDLPPSEAGTTYAPPPVDGERSTPAPRPVRIAGASVPAATTPTTPVRAAAPAPAAGNWRVQLGAFSTQARAETLWRQIGPRLGTAQPSYVPAGAVVRLQAGPYASRSAAQSACAAIAPAPCLAVAR